MRFAVRALVALVVLAVLAAGGYTAFWYAAAGTMRDAIAGWAAAPGAGTTATLGDIAISGFPSRLVADIPGVEVRRTSGALVLTYTAEGARIVHPLRGGSTSVSIRGLQTINVRAGTAAQTLRAKTDATNVQIETDEDGAFAGFNLVVTNLTLERPDLAPLTTRRMQLQMRKGSGAGTFLTDRSRFALRIEALAMPEYRRGPLGDTVELFSTNAVLTKGIDGTDVRTALTAWRDAGGYLTLLDTQLKWGSLDLQGQGSGVLKLDGQMRPAGGMNVQLRDYLTTIDAFHAARRLSDQARAAVQQMVGFFGGGGRIGLPLEIVNGEIVVGPATLGTVDPILPATGG